MTRDETIDRLWAHWIEADDRGGTHYEGCEMAHWRCALRIALEAARAASIVPGETDG